MEPNNDPQNRWRDDSNSEPRGNMHALVPGVILVGIGALFLLGNLHIVHVRDWFAYWPVILVAIGLVQLVDANHSGGRVSGAVLLGIGALFLADNLGYIWFNLWDLWPLLLIGAGVMMLLNRTGWGPDAGWYRRYQYKTRRHGPFGTGMPMFGGVHEFAIFGGSRRVITDQEFKGGRVSCVFGGINLDLTGAVMVGNSAVLDISTVYGGAVVRIPPSWNLEVRGAGVFGGFADHTIHPPASPDMKRLIVRGAAVFGGVTFKN